LDAAGINYEIKFPNLHQQHFDTQLRRDLYLLCKEACTNIAKYSAAKKVQLTIDMQPHQLLLSIIDDGTGFDVEKALNGDRNGVKNLIQRAQSYKNGSITIDSEIGIGTKIFINLPLKNGTNM
jgi:signal transduction histidine kinase